MLALAGAGTGQLEMNKRKIIGIAAIVFAVFFNIPFSILGASYDYPDILRRPAAEALDKFAAGGSSLILTWYGFGLAALLLIPLAIALSIKRERLVESPAASIGAAIAGALAGLAQAIGLMRWVFAIPYLAARHADPLASAEQKLAAERSFELLNAWGGVAIGEHIGQLLTALFVLLLSYMQSKESWRLTSYLGFATAALIVLGSGEGLALALKASGDAFSLATIAGFMGLTLWLIATGVQLVRNK
jgi:hypothetical protein